MDVYRIDPLKDPRWAALVARHPQSAIFHSVGWIEALRRTYGYEPVAYTTSPPGHDLADGVPFCRIRTWLTGKRLVSLPFSDHCAPLVDTQEALDAILVALQRDLEKENWQYIEMRPSAPAPPIRSDFAPAEAFALHMLDLRPGLRELFRGLHKDCVQRKIQRAEREGLYCEQGNSESLLRKFYPLLLKTRRRHGLPPQPIEWFRNLVACLGGKVCIRIASKKASPVAAILTLVHGKTLVYKYGCSDERFNNLGGTQLLFWKAIEGACTDDLAAFDLGRSELANPGLVTFKDRWGAARTPLLYFRCSLRQAPAIARSWPRDLAKYCFAHIPNPFLAAAGRLLYRHIG
jgi:GNAT acetyltransferase-like protein